VGDIVLMYHQILRTNIERNLQQRTLDSLEKEKDHVRYHFKRARVKKMYLILVCYRK